MSDTALVVMARYPEEGKTKTRLARSLGDAETAQLYRAFLIDLANRFTGQALDLIWTYTPPDVDYACFLTELAPSLTGKMQCFPQRGADFASRLLYAFQWPFEHGYRNMIIIGSDSPHISATVIGKALDALDKADVVLGPAEDGGYYLIAMRQPHDVFSGILMSTSEVLAMTIALAQQQGLTVKLIDTLFDVDEMPDLLRLAQLLHEDSSRAPVTAAMLAKMNIPGNCPAVQDTRKGCPAPLGNTFQIGTKGVASESRLEP
jgi:rSAM/selenodomain-associated transferase 1